MYISLAAVRCRFLVRSESKQKDRCVWPRCWRLGHGHKSMATGWRCVPARHLDTVQYSNWIWSHWIFLSKFIFDSNEIPDSSHLYGVVTVADSCTLLRWQSFTVVCHYGDSNSHNYISMATVSHSQLYVDLVTVSYSCMSVSWQLVTQSPMSTWWWQLVGHICTMSRWQSLSVVCHWSDN